MADDFFEEPSNPEPSDEETQSMDLHILKASPSSIATKKGNQPVDAQELAIKFKRKMKTETKHRLNQLKQKQSDITTKLKEREIELKRKALRDAFASDQSHSPRSVSNRTAQLLQEQRALSKTISNKRKHSLTEAVYQREIENAQIQWSKEQLDAIDTVSEILLSEMRPPLESAVDDLDELHLRQSNFFENFSKHSIWFNKEQRQRLNAMSITMNKVPTYRRKLVAMKKKMNEISKTVERMKMATVMLKQELGIQE